MDACSHMAWIFMTSYGPHVIAWAKWSTAEARKQHSQPRSMLSQANGGLVAIALVLVIFTIFAAVRLHVQLVRFGRFVRSERACPGRAVGFTCVMRHLNHAKTNRTSNGARTKKWWLFDVAFTPTGTGH